MPRQERGAAISLDRQPLANIACCIDELCGTFGTQSEVSEGVACLKLVQHAQLRRIPPHAIAGLLHTDAKLQVMGGG